MKLTLFAMATVNFAGGKHLANAPLQTCHTREPQYMLSTLQMTHEEATASCTSWGGELATYNHGLEIQ